MSARIEDYALIGDTQTAALVGRDGSIDWWCVPRFDSGAVFAALLGTADHGRWLLAPAGGVHSVDRTYRGDTLVLETTFHTDDGDVRITDCMPLRGSTVDIVREVEGLSGRVPIHMELVVRFDYGSIVPWVYSSDAGLRAVAGPDALVLHTAAPTRGAGRTTVSDFVVEAGERMSFILAYHESHVRPPRAFDATRAINGHDPLVEAVVRPVHVRGRVAGRGDALADHLEGAHLRADRRHRRPRPRPPSRSGWVVSATGTTGTAGCGTPRSR